MLVLLNVALSYAAWFAVAVLAARGHFWLAVIPSLLAVAVHLGFASGERRSAELKLSLAAVALGLGVETIHMASGATQYQPGASIEGLPPAFMLGLWPAFAMLINVSLAWLKDRMWVAVVLGALASGPSYFAGAKLGALTLGEPVWHSLAIIGAVWAIAFPALIAIARRLDR